MLGHLGSLFVGRPGTSLMMAGAWLAAWLLLQQTSWGVQRSPRWLLLAGAAWAAYAFWEWSILRWSPEANIRVDLMVIWPGLLLLCLFAVWQALRSA